MCSLISFHTRCSHIYSYLPNSFSPAKSVCSWYFCSQHQSYLTELFAGEVTLWIPPLFSGALLLFPLKLRHHRTHCLQRAKKGCWKNFYYSVTHLHFHLFQPMTSISFSCWYCKTLQPFTDQLWVFILCEVDSNGKQF